MDQITPAIAALSPKPNLEEALAAAGIEYVDGGAMALFHADSVAAALIDRSGGVAAASSAFMALKAERHIDAEALARAFAGAAPATLAVELGGDAPSTALFAYALAAHTGGWRLPPQVRDAANRNPGYVVILTSQTAHAEGPLEAACLTYGLNGLQTRVVVETIRTGQVKAAAEACGVSYHTAREAVAEAMKRARVARLPALVSSLTSLSFGVLPEGDSAAILADLWGLTARQSAIAVLIASGASRAGAAQALAVSGAVVRKGLEEVHQLLQVSSSAELARKVVEAQALRWMIEATGGDAGFTEAGAEPLRFIHRPDGGGKIAVSDYGPASGAPLLVVHSNLNCRTVARGLLRSLQAAGYRPIAIDRPGFGLTDETAGAAQDPFGAAAADTLRVLDQLRIRRVDLVARGAAQVVLALARAAPERLGRVVLVNPAPPSADGGTRSRAIGAVKEAHLRNPALIRLVAPFYVRQGTYEGMAERLQRWVRGSPPDEAAMRDPELLRDCFRAVRPFAAGRIAGYVNEVSAMMRRGSPRPLPGTDDWRILLAAHDFMHDPARVAAYWTEVLPDARLSVVPHTGRYLAMSHPHLVVAALKESP